MRERGCYGHGRSQRDYIGADGPEVPTTKDASGDSTTALLVLAGILGGGVLASLFATIREARKPRAPYYPSELARRDAERAKRTAEASREEETRRS